MNNTYFQLAVDISMTNYSGERTDEFILCFGAEENMKE